MTQNSPCFQIYSIYLLINPFLHLFFFHFQFFFIILPFTSNSSSSLLLFHSLKKMLTLWANCKEQLKEQRILAVFFTKQQQKWGDKFPSGGSDVSRWPSDAVTSHIYGTIYLKSFWYFFSHSALFKRFSNAEGTVTSKKETDTHIKYESFVFYYICILRHQNFSHFLSNEQDFQFVNPWEVNGFGRLFGFSMWIELWKKVMKKDR